jgi:thioredoxin reductase
MVVGRVPLVLGCSVENASVESGKVQLRLRSSNGEVREIAADHVIAATGYRVDLGRLKFLSAEVRDEIKTVDASPVLSSRFESSIDGLYFVGVAAANSFGPLMRFAYGASFAARRITRALAKATAENPTPAPAIGVATATKYRLEGRTEASRES